jgi:hypothetical protein
MVWNRNVQLRGSIDMNDFYVKFTYPDYDLFPDTSIVYLNRVTNIYFACINESSASDDDCVVRGDENDTEYNGEMPFKLNIMTFDQTFRIPLTPAESDNNEEIRGLVMESFGYQMLKDLTNPKSEGNVSWTWKDDDAEKLSGKWTRTIS